MRPSTKHGLIEPVSLIGRFIHLGRFPAACRNGILNTVSMYLASQMTKSTKRQKFSYDNFDGHHQPLQPIAIYQGKIALTASGST